MVLFFALFGFLFLSTQYLQFVLGYSPLAAGVRVLPYAGAMIVFAPLSAQARRALRHQARRDRRDGCCSPPASAVAATIDDRHRLRRGSPSRFVLMGAGMGLAGAPATESIMGSLPPERANIGSAVNDTTRELGGALGVAVVGSIMSSLYAGRLGDGAPDSVRESLGAAVGGGVPGAGARGVRARDVAGVDRRRGRGRARRRARLALPAGAGGRGPRRSHRR